jgi:hypothetical protein
MVTGWAVQYAPPHRCRTAEVAGRPDTPAPNGVLYFTRMRPPSILPFAPVVYLNDAFVPRSEARVVPDDRGFLFGDGVYEVARAVDGRFFALDAHLERLAGGARALGLAAPDPADIVTIWTELLRA